MTDSVGRRITGAPNAPALVGAAEKTLSRSPSGAQIVQELNDRDVPIAVLPTQDFFDKYQDGRAGFFDPRTGKITAPVSQFEDPKAGAIMLAHEGTHALDAAQHHGGRFGSIASSLWNGFTAAVTAPLHLENPATAGVDALRSQANDDEVKAYMAQASVEKDLGIRGRIADYGRNADGSLRSESETRAALEDSSLYQEHGPMRVARTVVVGAAASMAAMAGVSAISGLLHHPISNGVFFGGTAMLTTAMAIEDWATHQDAHSPLGLHFV